MILLGHGLYIPTMYIRALEHNSIAMISFKPYTLAVYMLLSLLDMHCHCGYLREIKCFEKVFFLKTKSLTFFNCRKRDGTFNYSADVYCAKYDETTGLCPDGDE
jgi:hypothetical protein